MKITICGCGWLGLPLAEQLARQGHRISGTTRTKEKLLTLKEMGINGVIFTLGANLHDQALQPLWKNKRWVLNIPSQRHNPDPNFANHYIQLIDHIFAHGAKHVIFISTTSVFGEYNGSVDEHSPYAPSTLSGHLHMQIEQHLLTQYAPKTTIVRCAGLVDQHRHPVRMLARKGQLTQAQQPVNLVHKADVISALDKMLHDKIKGKIFHLCAPDHPSKAEYYRWAAEKLALPCPQFTVDESLGKTINSSYTRRKLNWHYQYASPYDMLN